VNYTVSMKITLPGIKKFSSNRSYYGDFEENCYIPIEKGSDIWGEVYTLLRAYGLNSPVKKEFKKYIDPTYGFFGLCTHPVTKEANYFHTGISMSFSSGKNVTPVLSGILEYSGYGAVNGYYVLISHPQIQTEDGYVFHSMYCHLKKPLIKFNSYQKILREVSLGSHPKIPIALEKIIGVSSVSGLVSKNNSQLYLQLSFRKFDRDAIVIDPMKCYQEKVFRNKDIQ